LNRQAATRGVNLKVEKLDVTNEGDRKKALDWGVEILVNNGPLLLTQGLAKQMVKRGKGRIVWVLSREGLNVNPFTGIYSASKHAVEAVAETIES